MRSIERVAPVAVALVALLVSLIAGGASLWMIVRDSRAEAAAHSPAYVASTKVYDTKGTLLSERSGNLARPPLFETASRFLQGEVSCETTANGTVCIEPTAAPLAIRLHSALNVLAICTAASVVLGFLAGMLIARTVSVPLRGMANIADKAAREHAYSLRAQAAGGDAGRLAASLNDLLAQMHERDVELRRRSTELESANKELEAFAYSVSHDLRGPLGSVDGFVQALETDYSDLFDEPAREYFHWIHEGCRQMRELIEGLLQMAKLARTEIQRDAVDLSAVARGVADTLQQKNPARNVTFDIRDGVRTIGDERLLRAVLENLMGNAYKFTRNRNDARIEFGQSNGTFYVRDNGAGFDPSHAAKMFRPFQRLHSSREFEGTGIGLATVQKIVERHGGRAWAEGEVDKGATIYFTTATA